MILKGKKRRQCVNGSKLQKKKKVDRHESKTSIISSIIISGVGSLVHIILFSTIDKKNAFEI